MTGTAGLAADATPEGAVRLTEVFQTYLGKTPGVVTVTPAGAVYDLRLDAGPLLAKMPEGEGTATVSPLVMQLTDNGDGTWGVTQDQALDVKIQVPGEIDMSVKVGSYKGTGVFDEKLGVFTTSSADFTDLTAVQTITTPETGQSHSEYSVASGHIDMTGSAGATGGADLVQTFNMSKLSQTIRAPMEPGGSPVDIILTADTYNIDGTMKGLRSHPVLGTLAFFIAHPSETEVKAAQEDLRGGLKEALPVFDSMTASGLLTNVAAQTPIGPVTVARLGVDVDANGLVADGMAREAINLDGLVLPPGLVPEWAAALLPEKTALDVKVSGFDLANPIGQMIATFDLTKPEPLEQAFLDSLLPAFLPNGAVDITLAPGETVAQAFTLGYEGTMKVGPEQQIPTGTAKISLKGYDAIIAALSGAPPEVGQQMLPALTMIRGMAQQVGDTLVWDIDASTPGTMLVNGADLGPMLGQP
ncbi:hypothetical protein [Alitabrizicola rongguiensis]|uniref:hypothetical protein n=1 Tax=Alitabrizicola rongguiensis TaxID=2909234 RepID=UPI001F3594E9|nr:hypothetical protein [Tabrizicola rongguiensis]